MTDPTLFDSLDKHAGPIKLTREQSALVESVWPILPALVWHPKLRPFTRQYSPSEDAVQQAALGTIMATQTYDDSRGMSFRTWAFFYIQNALVSGLKTHSDNLLAKCGGIPRKCRVYALASMGDGFTNINNDEGDELYHIYSAVQDTTVEQRDTARYARAILSRTPLTQLEAQAVERWMDGDSFNAAARKMGIAQARPQQLFRAAVDRMRRAAAAGVESYA